MNELQKWESRQFDVARFLFESLKDLNSSSPGQRPGLEEFKPSRLANKVCRNNIGLNQGFLQLALTPTVKRPHLTGAVLTATEIIEIKNIKKTSKV